MTSWYCNWIYLAKRENHCTGDWCLVKTPPFSCQPFQKKKSDGRGRKPYVCSRSKWEFCNQRNLALHQIYNNAMKVCKKKYRKKYMSCWIFGNHILLFKRKLDTYIIAKCLTLLSYGNGIFQWNILPQDNPFYLKIQTRNHEMYYGMIPSISQSI